MFKLSRNKIILIFLIIFIISLNAVNAVEDNSTADVVKIDNNDKLKISLNDESSSDYSDMNAAEELNGNFTKVNEINIKKNVLTSQNEDILRSGEHSYTDLENLINNTPDGGVIDLEYNYKYTPDTDGENYPEGVKITKSLTINGYNHAISGENLYRIFYIIKDVNVVLNNITFANGNVHGYGAAISTNATTYVNNCTFENNNASGGGGAIYTGGDITVRDSYFLNNYAYGGGAINIVGANDITATITSCYFENNSARTAGAINLLGHESVDINYCCFINNTASFGSAVFSYYNINVDYNWWGNNDPDFFSLIGRFINANNWVMANLTCDYTNLSTRLNILNTTSGDIIRFDDEDKLHVRNVTYTFYDGTTVLSNSKSNVSDFKFGFTTAKIDNQVLTLMIPGTYTELQRLIDETPENGVLDLEFDFKYNTKIDGDKFQNGVIINKTLTINGNNYIISGDKQRRIFNITSNDVVLNNIIFTNGNTANNGGAIYIETSAINTSIINSIFTDNADNNGYAIYNNGTLTLNNNKISNITYNNGKIISELIATLLDGQRVPAELGQNVVANATLTDGDGNDVYDSRFKISVDNVEIADISYDKSKRLYTSEYAIAKPGIIPVSTAYNTDILTIINGSFKSQINVDSFVIVVNNAKAGENATGNVTLLGLNGVGLNETFAIVINNKEIEVTTVNGTATFNVTGLNPGQYSALAIFESESYNKAYASDMFTVFEPQVQLNIEVENIAYGDIAVINITLKTASGEDYSGVVLVNISGSEVGVNVVNGKGSAEYINLDVDTYIVNATYMGDALHEPVNVSKPFEVVKASSEISISGPVIVENGTDVEIKFNILPAGAKGNVTLWIDGNKYLNSPFDESSGSFLILAQYLSVGSRNITVQYLGNDNYNQSANDSYILNVTVSKITPEITITVDNATSLFAITTTNVTITVQNGLATGKIRVDGYGEYQLENGVYVLELPDLIAGEYNIPVTYLGDEKYNTANSTIRFFVQKGNATPIISDLTTSVNVGENVTFIVTMDNNAANGTITVYVDGQASQITLDNPYSNTSVSISGLSNGNHTIGVRYDGNDNFEASDIINNQVIVNKLNSTITIVVDDIEGLGPMDATNVTISIPGATGQILIDNDGVLKFEELDENGTYKFEIYDLQAGEYIINITYLGDDKYNGANNSTTFNISKTAPQIQIDAPATANTTQQVTVTVSMKPVFATGTVTLYIDGVENQTVVLGDTGAANIIIPALTNGTHTIKAVYNGDLNYNTSESDVKTITINKAESEIIIQCPDEAKVGQEVEIQFEITPDTAYGAVTLWIDGTEYDTKEFDTSSSSFTIPAANLTAGKHNITVQFLGNEQYLASNNDSHIINITKNNVTDITVSGSNINPGETATVTIEGLPKDAKGNITVTIDGETYNATVENGNAVVEIPGLTEGAYELFPVIYSGDDKYNDYTAMATIIVKTTPEVNITVPKDLKPGDDANITVSIPNATGDITVIIDGKETIATLDNGKANVTISNITAGEHNIVVVYPGDEIYQSSTTTESIAVNKLNSTITIVVDDIEGLDPMDATNVTISIPGATGQILIDNDGVLKFEQLDANGNYTFEIYDLQAGEYVINVTYLGDEKYNGANNSTTFNIPKTASQIQIDAPATANTTQQVTVSVSMNPVFATGTVTLYIDGVENQTVVLGDTGAANIILPALTNGTHTIKAVYNGDLNYNVSESDVKTITINKAESEIIVLGPHEAKVGQEVEVKFEITPDTAYGAVTLWIDGTEYNTKEFDTSSSSFIIQAANLTAGKHNITVQFLGNEQYLASNNDSYIINITKNDVTDITVSGSNINPGETATVTIEGLPKDAKGNITVTIDGETYNATVENGNAVVEIPGLTEGIYELFPVIYSGDDKYNDYTAMATIIVKTTPEVNITVPKDLKPGDDANITISIANATGNITVIVDGAGYDVPLDENGTAIVPIADLTAGDHSVVVVYPGDELTAPTIATNKFSVADRIATEIVDVIINKDYVITAKLVDENGKEIANTVVNYTINGVPNTTVTDANGTFSIAGLSKCVIGIDYAGNETLLPTNTSVTLDFGRLSTYIVGDTFTQYAIDYYVGERGGYFEVQLFDETGKALANKAVKIGFNGVVYNSTTNETGWAKLQINLKNAGKYTFAVGFLGDDDFTGSMEVYLIQVNKKPTSITASSASYKASAKTKKYTVTLSTQPCSSIDGKTYMASGKVMKLQIGSKTYTATTNSNGKATFDISLTKKGTYTATVKFVGDQSYSTSSKTVKITLK